LSKELLVLLTTTTGSGKAMCEQCQQLPVDLSLPSSHVFKEADCANEQIPAPLIHSKYLSGPQLRSKLDCLAKAVDTTSISQKREIRKADKRKTIVDHDVAEPEEKDLRLWQCNDSEEGNTF
jgi:hypothetical protein